ncbi:hypothetical protein D3C76_806460 [compost metagenome]
MSQAQEVLLVEVFEVAKVILGEQVFAQLIVKTCEVEGLSVRIFLRAAHAQCGLVAGRPAFGAVQLARGQRQVVELFRGDLSALEGLRQ